MTFVLKRRWKIDHMAVTTKSVEQFKKSLNIGDGIRFALLHEENQLIPALSLISNKKGRFVNGKIAEMYSNGVLLNFKYKNGQAGRAFFNYKELALFEGDGTTTITRH